MRIVATSDTHGHLPVIPLCDVFIHAGDWTPATNHSREFQKNFLISPFWSWLEEIPAKHKVIIAGNHDFVARSDRKIMDTLPCNYLMNESIEIDGVKIWGSPYSGQFGNWAFMRDEYGLQEIWNMISGDTNILVTHGPAYGYGDKVMYYEGRNPHQGSRSLTRKIESLPYLTHHFFGHIHEAAGSYENDRGIEIMNLSYVNLDYVPRYNIATFDI